MTTSKVTCKSTPTDVSITALLSHAASRLFRRASRTSLREYLVWESRNFAYPPPPTVKQSFVRSFVTNSSTVVETGTYRGDMVRALAPHAKAVISIEADEKLHETAKQLLSKVANAILLFGPSEKVLPGILSGLHGEVVFWLDGHYSGEGTYQGACDSPVKAELSLISRHLSRWNRTTILIDDARSFDGQRGYPDLAWVFEWAQKHGLRLRFSHDMIVMESRAG